MKDNFYFQFLISALYPALLKIKERYNRLLIVPSLLGLFDLKYKNLPDADGLGYQYYPVRLSN